MSQREEVQLTPAAKAALEEYLQELRSEVLWRAERAHSTNSEEIGLREIVSAAEEVSGRGRPTQKQSRLDLLLRLYGLGAIALVVVGVVVASIPSLSSLTGTARFGWLTAFTGALLAFATVFLREWMRHTHLAFGASDDVPSRGQGRDEDVVWQFVRAYSDLERQLRSAVAETAGESSSSKRLADLVGAAAQSGLWTSQQADVFLDLTRLRNAILHEGLQNASELPAALRRTHELRRQLGVAH